MLGRWSLARYALGELGQPSVAATTVSYALTGRSATFQVACPVAAASYALTGSAAALMPTTVAARGSFVLTGNAATFALSVPVSIGSYALAGISAGLVPKLIVSAGSFTASGVAAAFQVGMAQTQVRSTTGTIGIGRSALCENGSLFARVALTFNYSLTGAAVAFDPFEAAATGIFAITGRADLSYDLLGGGGVISGGTFSRRRWRGMLDELAREREAEQQRIRTEALRRRADKERARRAAAEARRAAREAAKAEGEALADAIASAHAAQAQAGLRSLQAAVAQSAVAAQAARLAAATREAEQQDEEEALALLMAA